MKGFILAGGKGTRLYPLTGYINKTLLPVYDRPMIWYPYQTLKRSGVDEVYIICQKDEVGAFAKVFGEDVGYIVQNEPKGIASVFKTIERYVDDNFVMILGDNIYEDKLDLRFVGRGKVFLKEVDDPQRFGVASFDASRLVKVYEKPDQFISKLAVTGCYCYSTKIFSYVENLQPSARGEMEITDVNNIVARIALDYELLQGYWKDAGTFDALLEASQWRKNMLQEDLENDCIL